MKLKITHTSNYTYDRNVQIMPHLLYLRPRENPLLQVSHFSFSIQPHGRIDWMRDDFDNLPASVQFSAFATQLEIRSDCTVITTDSLPFDFLVRDYATTYPFTYEALHLFNLSIYMTPPPIQVKDQLLLWLKQHFIYRPPETVAWLSSLNQTIFQNLNYQRRDEPGIQSASDTINSGTGTCRDYAMLLIECARSLGLAARFVSGYLFDQSIDGSSSGDMHAWVEVFLPGAGWRGIDPTHGIFCDNTYIPVAHAVVAESVNPIQGSFISEQPATASMNADVRVVQIKA